jgi:hypothetical protein
MTEGDWPTGACALLHVVGRAGLTDRQVRLFSVAVCRRFWGYLSEESQALLISFELLADGLLLPPR